MLRINPAVWFQIHINSVFLNENEQLKIWERKCMTLCLIRKLLFFQHDMSSLHRRLHARVCAVWCLPVSIPLRGMGSMVVTQGPSSLGTQLVPLHHQWPLPQQPENQARGPPLSSRPSLKHIGQIQHSTNILSSNPISDTPHPTVSPSGLLASLLQATCSSS